MRLAQLSAELKRRDERVRWSQRMKGLGLGYVPMAKLIDEDRQRDETRWRFTLPRASLEKLKG